LCSPSSASSAPSAVDTSGETLITFTAYNSAGEVWQTTASDGSYTQSFFDDAGRPMGTIEYDRFGSTILSTGTTYGAGDLVATSSTTTSSGTDTTAYDYGTTVDTSTPSLFTNDAVAEILYPGSTNPVKYTFNRQGQMTTMTDQNETTHTYTYDGDGRLLADSVSVPTDNPANIDMTVQSIRYAYQACGRLDTVTSYDSPYDPSEPTSGDIVNQVKYAYDTYGNMIGEYQQQGSAVDMSTSLYVGYGYDTSTTTTDGITTSNTDSRPTSLQYPTTGTNTSRTITYAYTGTDSQAGIDDAINRLDSVGDGTGTADEPTVTPPALESFSYLGTDTVIKQDYGQPQISLDYAGTTSGSYPGLDQFDRVANQVWKEIGSDPSILDAYGYGRDAASNVTYRKNNTASGLDQVYTNDYLGQLTSLDQGQIATDEAGNVTVDSSGYASLASTANLSESWAPDGTGNWTSFSESSTTNSALDQSETQTPTANNQIGTLGSGSTWAQPAYDAAGNMTTIPQPGNPSVGMGGKFDAWGRLTQVTIGSTTVKFSHDGLGRVVSRTSGTSVTFYLYAGPQLLETRVGTTSDTPETAAIQYQYVWSPTGINVPILRDTYSDGELVPADRLYYLTDANNNVTAVTDDTGAVQERYSYDAYGNVTIYDADWVQRSSSSVNNTLLFAGMFVDPTTGLYYARARWYNPSTGGFITQDPSQAETNLYGYAGDDPISESDPTGLAPGGSFPSTTCNTGDDGGQSIPAGLTISTSDGSGQYVTGEHITIKTWPEQIGSFFPLDQGDALALQMTINQSTPPGNGVPPIPTELDRQSIAAEDERLKTVYNNSVASGASPAATYYTTAGMFFADHTGVTNLYTAPYFGSSQEPVTLQKFSFNQRLARAAAGSFQITVTALTIKSLEGMNAAKMPAPCEGAAGDLTTPSGGQLRAGATIYRASGGPADEFGSYWTTVDPAAIPNYRAASGLPLQNTGQTVTVGMLIDLNGVSVRSATPIPGITPYNALMVPEVYVPNPAIQIKPITTFDVDPPF
jgi:RHS repeat-associated protein